MRIVRYKNGSLYCRETKQWLTLQDIFDMPALSFEVVEAKTNKDITAEVTFLARVDEVRRKGLWKRATVVVSPILKRKK